MLEDLGQSLYRLSYRVPFPGVPPVNAYLLKAGQPVLIDCGPADDGTYDELCRDLKQIGLTVSDIGAVLVSHKHLDHVGQAGRLARESEAVIYLHRDEWPGVSPGRTSQNGLAAELESVLIFWGVPRPALEDMRHLLRGILHTGVPAIPEERLTAYPDGPFRVAGTTLQAIHCPGHSEGLVCLWSPERRWLFTNDHVLEDITPNPTLYVPRYRGRRCGLAHYLESLEFVARLEAELVLPGHGRPFRNAAGRIGAIRRAAGDRRERIVAAVKGRPRTVLQLTDDVWGRLSPINAFLAAREVHGHLEMLLEEGQVRVVEDGGVGHFEVNHRKS